MTQRSGSRSCKLQEAKKKSVLRLLLQSDLANDVDEISPLEGQLVWLIGQAVP